MTRTIKSTDVHIKSVKELTDSIGIDLGEIWHELDGKPKAQAIITQAWQKIEQLYHSHREVEALMVGAQAAVIEMGRQRDLAVHDSITWRKHGEELARRILAGQVAIDGDIPVTDVMLVLDVLAGKKSTFEEPRLEILYEAIKDLANAVFEEQVFNAANADES